VRRVRSTADQWGPVLAAAALIVVVWIVARNEVAALNDRVRTEVFSRVAQVSTSYQNDVSSSIKLVDNILRFIADYAIENGTARTESMVRRASLYDGVLRNISIADVHRNATAFSAHGVRKFSLSDRSYIRDALGSNELVIGAPFIGHLNKHVEIPFARLHRADRHSRSCHSRTRDLCRSHGPDRHGRVGGVRARTR
jgi:hypothetical protein